MNCEELIPLLTRILNCEDAEFCGQFLTHCLYPSSDPVFVNVSRLYNGFQVDDGGGAMRSAMGHVRTWQAALEKAGRRYSVDVRDGAIVAIPEDEEWLYPAVLAVSNASALAARLALEANQSKSENTLKDLIDRKSVV